MKGATESSSLSVHEELEWRLDKKYINAQKSVDVYRGWRRLYFFWRV
jgi:hypothetical protein